MANNPNRKFAALLARTGCSHKGFARRVLEVAHELDTEMSCDHTTVQRWLDGVQPRGTKPHVIAEALSRKLGVAVSVSDIGMGYAKAVLGQAVTYPEHLADSFATIRQLVGKDLSSVRTERPVDTELWSEMIGRWFIDPDDERVPQPVSGLTAASVDLVHAATEMFSQYDYRFGGSTPGLLVAQVLCNDILPSLDRVAPGSPLAAEYLSEVGALLRLAAWTAYDVGDHWLAQSYFAQALRMAKAAGNRTLGGRIFAGMSHQANFLGHHQRAVSLARAAREGFRGQGTPTAIALAWAMEARAHASLRDERACLHAIDQAERCLARREPANEPEWLRFFDMAEFHAEAAHCFRDLGRPEMACRHAELSIKSSESLYVRSLSFCRTVLATGHLLRGEVEEAVDVARGVVDTASGQLRSRRVLVYIGDFRGRLSRHGDAHVVRDFEELVADRLQSRLLLSAASGPAA
jgi:hypothetical protein